VLFWHGWADRRGGRTAAVVAAAPRPDTPRKTVAKAVK